MSDFIENRNRLIVEIDRVLIPDVEAGVEDVPRKLGIHFDAVVMLE